MKISNLSRRSGVSVATIKFYLREHLLPPGVPTARNQAEYDETHVARLRLIRVLTGMGMMSLASVREVLAALDDNCMSPHGLAKVVNNALSAEHPARSDVPADTSASAQVDRFLTDLGWRVDPNTPGRATLAQVLVALRDLGWDCEADIFAPCADAAERLAVRELDSLPTDGAATAVARTVLLEVAFAVMRRMAYEHYLAIRAHGSAAPER
ncbi:MerR family transcriptional regulator [Catellatospora tritici]|jgi:DNA-binding transcriptional MerR regulator|uniref:MerR family transcriptional regulator n=1 Tax=Catellatospora tritici TaxID=2851566 RepID=UPI001C2D63CE|nr:MerR family transcriptional regulator [Catellatospora tritici]MBV1849295.1 MerR family transcriptional regulator [Catellatospora tritici]